jgi:chemotaxis protein CheD
MSLEPRTPAGKVRTASVPVRMGALAVSNDPASTFSVIGLGSCVGLAIVSPDAGVAGLAHVVLPDSAMAAGRSAPPGKFADTAVPTLVERLMEKGAELAAMNAVMVGGAAMFGGRAKSKMIAIGEQNVEALIAALDVAGVRLAGGDVGGLEGRSMRVLVGRGQVLSRTISGTERELFPAGLERGLRSGFMAA